MCWEHNQRTIANQITIRAVHLQIALWVAWDATIVLLIASIPEERDTLDLIDDCGGEGGNRACNKCRTLAKFVLLVSTPSIRVQMNLPIASSNHGCFGAFCVGKLEQAGAFSNSSICRSL